MIIRDFTESDRAEYVAMSHAFYESSAVVHPVPETFFLRTFDQVLAKNPLMRGLILEHEGARAGFGHISLTWSNEAGGMVVLLEELYIKPEFRNLKLGTQYLTAIIDEYRNRACRFRLEVSESNEDARRLYARLGFEHLDYLQMIIETPI
ncbi:MAG: GNAT family N-acetyltransferase, partial [Clostridia bacterium]